MQTPLRLPLYSVPLNYIRNMKKFNMSNCCITQCYDKLFELHIVALDGNLFAYLTFLHSWLLSTFRAVPCHNASPKILTVPSPFLHGIGFWVIAATMGQVPALHQTELFAKGPVFLFHFPHAYLKALSFSLTRGCVTRAMGLRFNGRQWHWLSICGGKRKIYRGWFKDEVSTNIHAYTQQTNS